MGAVVAASTQPKKLAPMVINVYLNTLRLVGNIGAHEGGDSKEEVEAVLPIFVRTVEWFVDYVSTSKPNKP